ncbi:hypothetical protein [Streptomyces sp. NPDC050388]|uniref:hypothetical protein n=1 Tax=Streptomyces sp. NPDC050388 TaxID=3155781 RepID=UPI00343898D2
MTAIDTTIDQLLARALLQQQPRVPTDTVPYEDCAYPALPPGGPVLWEDTEAQTADDTAMTHLNTLCETAVSHSTAFLEDFVTEQLPAPHGAWVLGCVLQLADADEGARFWWQYAAGAGDDAASYCLYLHHQALGETYAANFWLEQTSIGTEPETETVTVPGEDTETDTVRMDRSTTTVLRILDRLASPGLRTRSETVTAVLSYVPAAVTAGYDAHPDREIPLPGQDFATHIAVILATTTHRPASPTCQRRDRSPAAALPNRADHARRGGRRVQDAARSRRRDAGAH